MLLLLSGPLYLNDSSLEYGYSMDLDLDLENTVQTPVKAITYRSVCMGWVVLLIFEANPH